jgi:tRNA (guanine-N7-)-methyltransferase
MSFGISRGKAMDAGEVGLFADDLPPMPDDVGTNPRAAWLDIGSWYPDPANPLEIEIGSGKGTFLVQEAPANPGVNYLGIEWAKEFAVYAMDRLRRNAVRNVKLLCGDGVEFIRWRVRDASVRVIHLYFPDPWPKTRHHKRRTISDAFLAQAHRVLVEGGELRVVTDHAEYWAWMEEHFSRWAGEKAESSKLKAEIGGEGSSAASAPAASPLGGEAGRLRPGEGSLRFERFEFTRPASAAEGEVVGTNFERKYRREGRPFYGAVLRKQS